MARPVLRTELCDTLGLNTRSSSRHGTVARQNRWPGCDLCPSLPQSRTPSGLSVLGSAGSAPSACAPEINKGRTMTDKPFGVDLLLPSNFMGGAAAGEMPRDPRDLIPKETTAGLKSIASNLGVQWQEAPRPAATAPRPSGGGMSDAQMEVVIEEKIAVFASGLGSPAPWIDRLKANRTKILCLVGNVKNAKRVAGIGADAVVAQGTEAGGHTGRIATFALVPQVIDAVAPTPVIAAGGIADGRGLAAAHPRAEAPWASGVAASLVAEEANQPTTQKQRVLDAGDERHEDHPSLPAGRRCATSTIRSSRPGSLRGCRRSRWSSRDYSSGPRLLGTPVRQGRPAHRCGQPEYQAC
ncbi:nitronate monooxygenase [Candidatus Amarobacter glycogenicus]|uniref:nitronate monooxygenase n=1 Tax=Candidatus Amarobacter glycogenicus TaxID=3140699 RepID=UPI002A138BF8|nr:nitronate monooxygenase [Dehalococcoidia bacterium]